MAFFQRDSEYILTSVSFLFCFFTSLNRPKDGIEVTEIHRKPAVFKHDLKNYARICILVSHRELGSLAVCMHIYMKAVSDTFKEPTRKISM